MACETHSKKPNWDRTVYLYVNTKEDFKELIEEENRSKIVLISSGTLLYTDGKRETTVVSAPALVFIGEEQFPIIEVHNAVEATAIYFHPSVLNDALDYKIMRETGFIDQIASTTRQDAILLFPILGIEEYKDRQPWLHLNQASYLRIKELFDAVSKQLREQKDDYWPCRSRSYFIELLIFISTLMEERNVECEPIPTDYPAVMQSVLQYMHINYSERITLEQLSRKFGINRNTLSKLFRNQLQMTPMQYLIQLRIHFASTLLTDTELPVTEISLRCGFFDPSHFGRTFKQYMNCSPVQYRNAET